MIECETWTRHRTGSAAATLLIGGMLTACAGAPADTPGPADRVPSGPPPAASSVAAPEAEAWLAKDPCTLLTAAEIAQATGEPATPSAPGDPIGAGLAAYKECDWTPKGTGGHAVELQFEDPDNHTLKTELADPDFLPQLRVDVGDAAYRSAGEQQVSVLVGNNSFLLYAFKAEAVVPLAKLLASRLR
ncbi:MAG TPA: DUF3558 family protein [Pseudonocardia sp.]|nr:DUF3558 family protein [Pseudonocardia sp.]